jgi:cytochrome c oxidase subunit IV
MAIVAVILVPPGAILFLMALMALEGNHTFFNRTTFFAGG